MSTCSLSLSRFLFLFICLFLSLSILPLLLTLLPFASMYRQVYWRVNVQTRQHELLLEYHNSYQRIRLSCVHNCFSSRCHSRDNSAGGLWRNNSYYIETDDTFTCFFSCLLVLIGSSNCHVQGCRGVFRPASAVCYSRQQVEDQRR